jgi:hypothetical protein
MRLTDLPFPVQTALVEVGRRFEAAGIHLFVFGSFARGDARPNSDLDIGIQWRTPPEAGDWRALQDAIEGLPTIRPVDYVDLRFASPALVHAAEQEAIPLVSISPAG